jgi:hypothetical protein
MTDYSLILVLLNKTIIINNGMAKIYKNNEKNTPSGGLF